MDTDNTDAITGTDTSGTQTAPETSSTGMASANTPAESGTSSSTTPDIPSASASSPESGVLVDPSKVSPPANQWDSPSNPYLKRFNDTLSHAQKLYQEKVAFQKQYEGIDPTRAREIMAKHQQQEAALKLQPYNKGHADHAKFQAVSQRADNYRAMLANAKTPEQREAIQSAAATMFSQDEIGMIEHAESDRKQLVEQFAADPRGFMSEMMQPVIQQEIQSALQYQMQVQQAQSFITDPKISGLIESHAEDMSWMLSSDVSARDKAIAYAQQKQELEQLKQQLGSRLQDQATAEARQSVGVPNKPARASNGQQKGIGDPVAYLKAKGIEPGTDKFLTGLQQINNGTYRF